ncbi:hypothetical protein F5Y06DRAFT_272615 [Hypoxylon sp. FL0890]|nr:hypothetical protein F5Y06DRAFT_272615 [Hypoxylon sp. FL0890]
MDSSQDTYANAIKKLTSNTPQNLNTSDQPSSIHGIDLLKLATSRNSAIGHISRSAPGVMTTSNYSYTPILPPELPLMKLPESATPRYQVVSSHVSSCKSSQKSHPRSSTGPVRIDGPSRPSTSEGRTPNQEPGVSLGAMRPNKAHTLPYTMSHFVVNGDEIMAQEECESNNDERSTTQSPKPPPLPYSLGLIEAENRRMSAEAKRAEDERARQLARTERMEAELKANFRWPGDTSSYPAQVMEDFAMPNSEFRAKAIHVGTAISENSPFAGVYAVRRQCNPNIEYRMARDSSPLEDIGQGPLVEFQNIRLNQYFQNMSESQIELWVRHLLATVPGTNNTVMKWT